MGEKKRKFVLPKHYADKRTSLEVLRDHGPLAVLEFAGRMRERGKDVPGPRKAFNVLQKLLVQGLVRRNHGVRTVKYAIGEVKQEVERSARTVSWEITRQGEKRLEYLLTRGRE